MQLRLRILGRGSARCCARVAVLLLACALLSACARPPVARPPAELNVFAAASLTAPFAALGKNFEAAHPNTRVRFNFAGSQQLAQQITQGAPADVFASANSKQIAAVVAAGQIASGTPQPFARNRLVVIAPKANPARLQTLRDLAKPGIKIVLAAPAVPVGGYALAFLDKASTLPEYTSAYSPTVLKNVVSYEENVKAVLSKVALGEADAGIVYTSDVALHTGKVTQIAIPDALNTLATYPIAPLTSAKQPELARQFIDYVLSPDGQDILTKYGFLAY